MMNQNLNLCIQICLEIVVHNCANPVCKNKAVATFGEPAIPLCRGCSFHSRSIRKQIDNRPLANVIPMFNDRRASSLAKDKSRLAKILPFRNAEIRRTSST